MDWLFVIRDRIAAQLGTHAVVIERVFWTLVVVVAFSVVRQLLRRLYEARISDPSHRYFARRATSYLLGLLAVLALLRVWLGGISGVATYLGIVTAGLAIALQDPLANLAGWLFIATRRPFTVGDRIQLGTFAGDVIDARLFAFSIAEIGNWVQADQSTGRIVHIPNGQVFKQPLANYTQGFDFVWNEMAVTVTFESDWRRAKELLLGIAERHTAIRGEEAAAQVRRAARSYLIFFEHLTPFVWVRVVDSGVTLTIRYLCKPRKRRSSEHEIWCDVLEAFSKEPGIDFAYPTTRFYDNLHEGKAAQALSKSGTSG